MRGSPYPDGTRLAQHSTRTVVAAALVTVGLAFAALFAVASLGVVVGLVTLAVAVRVAVTLGGRVRLRRRKVRRVLMVRVPFTNTVLEL